MKKKQNVYKRKRNFHFLRILSSIFFSAVLASFFALIGYSVAKPFGDIGKIQNEPIPELFSEPENPTEEFDDPNAVKAYWLPETEIPDMETLERMLGRIDSSYNTAVIPLKIKGGKLNYASANEGAQMAGASSETMELEEIVNAVRNHGWKPAASLDTLGDNLYPKADKAAGFVYKKGGELWYDAAENRGGKPWLSPSSSAALSYLCSITSEIASAGFELLIATNVQYPQFSRIGLDAIGETVTNENRYLDLIDTVNNIAGAADSKGKDMWIEIPAAEMFTETYEVFQPLLLETDKTVLKINLDDFRGTVVCGEENVDFSGLSTAEKVEKVCDIAETYIYKTSFIPEITGTSLTSTDKTEAAEVLKSMKYYSYVIR